MRCLIYDQNPADLHAIHTLLSEECPHILIIEKTQSLAEVRNILEAKETDLVFLNIDETTYHSSLELLHEFHQTDRRFFDTIFTSYHPNFEYALKAIEYSALAFLTKPFQRDKLRRAVSTAHNHFDARIQFKKQLELLFQINTKNNTQETVCIPLLKGELAFVPFHEIAFLESQTEVTRIQLQNGETILAMRNLGYFDKLLTHTLPFFRISQKIIVHLPYVRRYNHQELKVTLKNGVTLDASRQGGREFRRFFTEPHHQKPDLEFQLFLRRWLGIHKG